MFRKLTAVWLISISPLLCVSGLADAQQRTDRLALWGNPTAAEADVAFFTQGMPQPPGRSIMFLYGWQSPNLAAELVSYDFSRLDAVVVDEPYWGTTGMDPSNPCRPPSNPRCPIIARTAQTVQNAASIVRARSPAVRFWVNFSEPEITWMMDVEYPLPLNAAYIDVISLDAYDRNFEPIIRNYYDYLVGNRATPGQQIALVPGTFIVDGQDPWVVASYIPGYFAYANSQNASCNLPLGNNGLTGIRDGCLVWIVAGFMATTEGSGLPPTWHGLIDLPITHPIRQVWHQELARPLLDNMLGWVEAVETGPGPYHGIIWGWAIDRHTPYTPVPVDFWIDHTYAGGTRATIDRGDIGYIFGISSAGFNFTIPARFRDGATHLLEVFAVAPSVEEWNHILLNPGVMYFSITD